MRPLRLSLTSQSIDSVNHPTLRSPCRDPSRCKGVIELNEYEYRRWVVLIAAGTLVVAAIRLWIGG